MIEALTVISRSDRKKHVDDARQRKREGERTRGNLAIANFLFAQEKHEVTESDPLLPRRAFQRLEAEDRSDTEKIRHGFPETRMESQAQSSR